MKPSPETTEAWKFLVQEARNDPDAKIYLDRLWRAALKFAAAVAKQNEKGSKPGPVTGTGGRQLRSGAVYPFNGEKKGVAIEELDERDLEFLVKAMTSSVGDPAKARWRDANQKLLTACEKELAAR